MRRAKGVVDCVGSGQVGGRIGTRFKVAGVAEKIPTICGFARVAQVISGIHRSPGLSAIKTHNRSDLPAFEYLGKRLSSGEDIGGREGEAMPHVVVAAGILTLRVGAILRYAETGAKVPVRSHVVQGM